VARRHEPRICPRDLAGDARSIPTESFGLNFDPSHLVWQMIDYERAPYEGIGWQVPRLPGLGQVRWDRFVSVLYAIGYDDSLVIEHGDRYFEGEELVKRGFDVARNALRPNVVEADVDA
jgi:sugar phosphate isomerase/epimerase